MDKPSKVPGNSANEELGDAAAVYVAGLVQVEREQESWLASIRSSLPALGYAIPMVVHVMERRASNAVDHVVPWGFAEFSAIFRNLVETLSDLVGTAPAEEIIPLYFAVGRDEDPVISEYLTVQHLRLITMNERVSIEAASLCSRRACCKHNT